MLDLILILFLYKTNIFKQYYRLSSPVLNRHKTKTYVIFQGFINKTISLNFINYCFTLLIKLRNILAIDKVLVYVRARVCACESVCVCVWAMQGSEIVSLCVCVRACVCMYVQYMYICVLLSFDNISKQ